MGFETGESGTRLRVCVDVFVTVEPGTILVVVKCNMLIVCRGSAVVCLGWWRRL